MKILKNILIIALLLPANAMLAMDCNHGHGGHHGAPAPDSPRGPQPGADNPPPIAPRSNPGGSGGSAGSQNQGSPSERIFVGVATGVASGFILALANEALRAWLHPENSEAKENLSILELDKLIANTEHQIHILKKTMETTRDSSVAPQCRKEVEKAEKLFTQITALRNQRLGRLMSNATAKESLKPSTPK